MPKMTTEVLRGVNQGDQNALFGNSTGAESDPGLVSALRRVQGAAAADEKLRRGSSGRVETVQNERARR